MNNSNNKMSDEALKNLKYIKETFAKAGKTLTEKQIIDSLKEVEIVEIVPIIMKANEFNEKYLKTKKEKMGHLL